LRRRAGRGGKPGQRGRPARAVGRRRAPDRAGVSALGQPRVHYRRIGSTNARARELAAAGVPHGTVVTAAEQSEGRGRQGRTWTAAAGRALLGGRKVAGILVEGRPQEGWAVVGIGLNVALRLEDFPDELRSTAGTLGL